MAFNGDSQSNGQSTINGEQWWNAYKNPLFRESTNAANPVFKTLAVV